jgi:flagellum-specific ATP synthase
LSLIEGSEDLVRIGAYKPGADPELDRAIANKPYLSDFLKQDVLEKAEYADTVKRVNALGGGRG